MWQIYPDALFNIESKVFKQLHAQRDWNIMKTARNKSLIDCYKEKLNLIVEYLYTILLKTFVI